MPCIRIPNGVLCLAGPIREARDSTGKLWRWEFHRYLGPTVVGKRGDPLSRQPGSRSRFWKVFKEE